ncbi:hypothetical protein [Endozoicomonas sp. ONNA2]|uniref:hypothetical protein n=1 Tax=Endozoicomonas sp. ONNA2 TaxID=2828741 RepID=UPI00214802CD|nr:hypothetical protein [Endozoicomonas sp. ONNA2]
MTGHYDAAKVKTASMERANPEHHPLGLTELPQEMHLEICKYLESKSMMALRLSNSIFHNHIRTIDLRKKINDEFDLMKKHYAEKFLAECRVDASGNPIGDVNPLQSTLATREDRKPLEQLIIEILSNEEITEHLKSENSVFNETLLNHSINGKLPARENWDKHLAGQTFTRPDNSWINSVLMEILFRYHH